MFVMYKGGCVFAPQDDRYLFLDMNSFFARCEQQVNPALHNKPVVVAPYTGTTGCCIAVSYEAKTLGVKTGMGVGEARALIPNLTVVESRPELYRHVHHQLVAIINDFTPYVSVRSVDEMTFPLASYEQGGDRPFALAHMIKSALKQKLGEWLTASVGIGPNVFMAKQAAEARKPDGCVCIRCADIPAWLRRWQLTDLKGINTGMERQLIRLGITQPIQLYTTNQEILRKKLGVAGEYWWLRLHGYPIDSAQSPTKTIGHSCVLSPDARRWDVATQVLHKLVQRVGERLRAGGFTSSALHLYIRFLHSPSFRLHMRTRPFSDSRALWRYTSHMWERAPRIHTPFMIAITACDLHGEQMHQLPLFANDRKETNLYHALDSVNARFGQWTLKPASLIGTERHAPSRIPFGNRQL